jgi:hypothetical protein
LTARRGSIRRFDWMESPIVTQVDSAEGGSRPLREGDHRHDPNIGSIPC